MWMGNRLTFTASKKKQYKWPFSKVKVNRFNRLCNYEVSEEELHTILEDTHEYYLDEIGLSVNESELPFCESNAVYKLAQLDWRTKTGGESILVWMYKHEDGTFKHLEFGTRYGFDKIIACKRRDALIKNSK